MILISKGMKPITSSRLHDLTQLYINEDWPLWKRERSLRKADGLFDAYMTNVESGTETSRINNDFNRRLEDFQKATKRLEKYELSVGVPETTEEIDTGKTKTDIETGEVSAVTRTVVVSGIEPLDPESEQVLKDIKEREEAQRIIDNTEDEIYEFLGLEIPVEEEEESEDGED